MKLQSLLALALSVCVVFAAPAFAQSFYWNTASARSQALGGIYVASSDNAVDALAANPAGLTALSGPTLDVSVSLMLPRGSLQQLCKQLGPAQPDPGCASVRRIRNAHSPLWVHLGSRLCTRPYVGCQLALR